MVAKEPRLSSQTLLVLDALLAAGTNDLSGADIGRQAKLASGTLYPILLRLERAKWVESHWEAGDPHELGRPRRRYYRLTGLGSRSAQAAARELAPAIERLACA